MIKLLYGSCLWSYCTPELLVSMDMKYDKVAEPGGDLREIKKAGHMAERASPRGST